LISSEWLTQRKLTDEAQKGQQMPWLKKATRSTFTGEKNYLLLET
jgi:hypothetical protein